MELPNKKDHAVYQILKASRALQNRVLNHLTQQQRDICDKIDALYVKKEETK